MRDWLMVVLYSLLCGNLLILFTWDPSFYTRYIFSLAAILAVVMFFRRYEAKSLRITLIGLSIFNYFLFTVIYVLNGRIPLFDFLPPGSTS